MALFIRDKDRDREKDKEKNKNKSQDKILEFWGDKIGQNPQI